MRAFFVTQARSLDVSSVTEHGTAAYLLDRPPSPFKTSECLHAIEQALTLQSYQPGVDFIAIAGPSILTALLVAVAASRGPVNALLWDAPSERYVTRTVSITGRFVEERAS
tara:strand:- start:16411 stop:16743 length:333 start_codon:yes stop_codon:yes gene_type:complete